MRFVPQHVLVGELKSYAALREARGFLFYPDHCSWIVPKNSKQGETVLILIGQEFVGEAVIRVNASPSDVTGQYVSTLGAVKLWEPAISVETIGKQLPDWAYLTYTRSYASVPLKFQTRLFEAINQALEAEEEPEVISVPASDTIHIIEATNVHACPERFPWSSYRETPYMTFRHAGGAMKRLCSIEWTEVLPQRLGDLRLVPQEYRDRVQTYIERRESEDKFSNDVFRFYVFSTGNEVPLPQAPRLQRNIQGHCYFWLADLLSGEPIVQVASKSNGCPAPLKIKTLAEALVDEETRAPDEETLSSTLEVFEADIFDPTTLDQAREYQAKQVVARRGQHQFRQKLMEAYQEQCAFTGYFGKEALEAAHIVPFCGADSNHISNGLLLRADVHTLFDLGLIVVDTSDLQNLKLVLAPSLLNSSYKILQSKAVRVPQNASSRPSLKALNWHREQAGI